MSQRAVSLSRAGVRTWGLLAPVHQPARRLRAETGGIWGWGWEGCWGCEVLACPASLPAHVCVYMSFPLHLFSLCGCWRASCLGKTVPHFLPWPFVLLSRLWPCSSRGWSYTSRQCLRYPGRCRRWSRPPGRPSPAAQSLEFQRWRIHWPSKMAWQRCAPGRTPPPWRRRSTPPAGVSGRILMPQRTTWRVKTCQRKIKQGVNNGSLVMLTHLWFTNGVDNSEMRRKLAK